MQDAKVKANIKQDEGNTSSLAIGFSVIALPTMVLLMISIFQQASAQEVDPEGNVSNAQLSSSNV